MNEIKVLGANEKYSWALFMHNDKCKVVILLCSGNVEIDLWRLKEDQTEVDSQNNETGPFLLLQKKRLPTSSQCEKYH